MTRWECSDIASLVDVRTGNSTLGCAGILIFLALLGRPGAASR
ncbi:MAG: hypothetical protein JWM18_5141 [Chloroflexi bacterium]|jgi:hypothetical protein|nr:hypothetical protein [Chloroflexota bacterium]